MIFISNANSNTQQKDSRYTYYNSKSNKTCFSQYNFFAYNTFRSHWINGVRMFQDHGQAECANTQSIVLAASRDTKDVDINELVKNVEDSPPNTIVFYSSKTEYYPSLWEVNSQWCGLFACYYPAFMKFVTTWKWLDSYKDEHHLFTNDLYFTLINRTLCMRNLNSKVLYNER